MITPSFGGRSLEMVFPSIGGAMGVNGYENVLDLPTAKRYVVLLVDGLGYHLLREHAHIAPFLTSALQEHPMSCGVPSTTATSLTSLGTGLAAGRHGVVGYTSRVPATGNRINSLAWDQPVDPRAWQPHPSMLTVLAEAGIDAAVVNDAKFAESGLTVCGQRDVPFHGVSSSWERLETVVDLLESSERSAIYAYESRLDHAGHKYGCQSQKWRETLSTIDTEIRQLHEDLPADTVLIVTADHGMIDVPSTDRFDLESFRALRDDVTLIAGEARFRHVYTRPGTENEVASRWSEVVGERAIVRTQAGIEDWFGPIDAEVRSRIGDVVVAALADFAIFSSHDFAFEFGMVGFHGSITAEEMRIPLIVAD